MQSRGTGPFPTWVQTAKAWCALDFLQQWTKLSQTEGLTHLQFLASQGCCLVLSLGFAAPFGNKGHGTGPEQSERSQLGLGAHSMELHEVLHRGK